MTTTYKHNDATGGEFKMIKITWRNRNRVIQLLNDKIEAATSGDVVQMLDEAREEMILACENPEYGYVNALQSAHAALRVADGKTPY